MKRTAAIVVIVCAVAAAAAVPCGAAAVRLDIAPAAIVAGPQVTLGDIAAVHCDDADTCAKLRAMPIAAAPMPGKSRPLDTQYIKVRLRQHGFDPRTMQTTWPERVLITTRSRVVSGAELAAAGEQALRARETPGDGETAITCARPPSDMVLPEGALELKAEVLGSPAGASRLVKVTAWVKGRPQASHTISYQVRRFGPAVVASKQIERGVVITAGDVTMARCEVAPGVAFAGAEEVIGMCARRALRVGEVIARSAVAPRPVVERGQKVWVTAVCGAIRVRAQAIACADALRGSSFARMKNESSGETFIAQVDAAGRVFVTP